MWPFVDNKNEIKDEFLREKMICEQLVTKSIVKKRKKIQ